MTPTITQSSGCSIFASIPGENNDFKLQDEAHRELDARPQVARVTISNAGHFALNTDPGRIADLILEAVAAAARPRHPKNERRCAFA